MNTIVQTGGLVLDFELGWFQAPGVMAEIQAYDPLLVVYFDKQVQRFCIARRTPRGLHFLTVWQDEAGGYLPLDRRLCEAVARWDLRPPRSDAPKSADELAIRMDEADLARAQKIEDSFNDDIRHLSLSNRRPLDRVRRITE